MNRRPGDTAARGERRADFVIDYSDDNRLIGVELLRLTDVNASALNDIITADSTSAVDAEELAPLRAAA